MRRLLNRACASKPIKFIFDQGQNLKTSSVIAYMITVSPNVCHSFIFTAAIQALKRKKRFEKQLQQIDGTLSTIEMQREALEGANTNTAVLTNMKSAADALKAAHQNMYVTIVCYFFLVVLVDVAIDKLIIFLLCNFPIFRKHKGMSRTFTI